MQVFIILISLSLFIGVSDDVSCTVTWALLGVYDWIKRLPCTCVRLNQICWAGKSVGWNLFEAVTYFQASHTDNLCASHIVCARHGLLTNCGPALLAPALGRHEGPGTNTSSEGRGEAVEWPLTWIHLINALWSRDAKGGNKSTKSIVRGFSLAKALMTLILNICDIRVLNSRCRIYLASCLEEVGKLSFREKKGE